MKKKYRYNWLAGRFVPAYQRKPKPSETDQAELFFLLLILLFCLGIFIFAILNN